MGKPHQSNGISFIKVLPASSPSSPFLDGLASLILVYKAYLTSSQPKRAMNWQQPVNLTELLPDTGTVYHYLGSLTTPPLSETVEWYVCADTVMIGEQQLAAYQQLFAANNRKIQPLNDRPIIAERF